LARLRLQRGIEAGVAVGPVRQLVQGRRLVAAAGADVDAPVGRRLPAQRRDRVRVAELERARVVAVAEELVGRRDLELAVADAGARRPRAAEVDLALRVDVAAGRLVVLAAA